MKCILFTSFLHQGEAGQLAEEQEIHAECGKNQPWIVNDLCILIINSKSKHLKSHSVPCVKDIFAERLIYMSVLIKLKS